MSRPYEPNRGVMFDSDFQGQKEDRFVQTKDAQARPLLDRAYRTLIEAKRTSPMTVLLSDDDVLDVLEAILHASWTIKQLQDGKTDDDLTFDHFVKTTGMWKPD